MYELRYFITSINSWLTRDPSLEIGGFKLDGFLLNDALNYYDYLGLWSNLKRDSKEPRAVCCADKDNDSISELAKIVGHDPNDFNKWLRTKDGKTVTTVKKGTQYTVPNSVHITYGNLTSLHVSYDVYSNSLKEMKKLEKDFVKEKYHIINHITDKDGMTSHSIQSVLSNLDIAIWAHAGHGKGIEFVVKKFWSMNGQVRRLYAPGTIMLRDEGSGLMVPKGLAPANNVGDYAGHPASFFTSHHKLSKVILYVCYAGQDRTGWSRLKSSNGILYANEQKVRIGRSWKSLPTK